MKKKFDLAHFGDAFYGRTQFHGTRKGRRNASDRRSPTVLRCRSSLWEKSHLEYARSELFIPVFRKAIIIQPHEYSGRFYTACPAMETGDSGMMETAIPEIKNQ